MTAPLLAEWLAPLMGQVGLPVLTGGEHLTENDAPPRLVWIPSEDQYEGAEQGGDTRKTVVISWTGFAVHCWGKTHDDAREQRRRLLVAFDELMHGAWRVYRSEWLTRERAGWCTDGEVYVLHVGVREGVDGEPYALATPETEDFDASGAAAGDGVLTAGETS
jgi:hypothetical protein